MNESKSEEWDEFSYWGGRDIGCFFFFFFEVSLEAGGWTK